MGGGNKKSGPVDNFLQEKVSANLKKEKNSNCEDNSDIPEVDDKLIGDDLDMKEAQEVPGDNNGTRTESEENDY
jgi:hypothetical protein